MSNYTTLKIKCLTFPSCYNITYLIDNYFNYNIFTYIINYNFRKTGLIFIVKFHFYHLHIDQHGI